jgi:hypothetical protein
LELRPGPELAIDDGREVVEQDAVRVHINAAVHIEHQEAEQVA